MPGPTSALPTFTAAAAPTAAAPTAANAAFLAFETPDAADAALTDVAAPAAAAAAATTTIAAVKLALLPQLPPLYLGLAHGLADVAGKPRCGERLRDEVRLEVLLANRVQPQVAGGGALG